MQPERNLRDFGTEDKNRGFGGFPMPWIIINKYILRLFPVRFKERISRTMSMPATISITPTLANSRPGAKQVPYITFEAVVGRNSAFYLLTRDQRGELGGIEYRALNALLWIIPIVSLNSRHPSISGPTLKR